MLIVVIFPGCNVSKTSFIPYFIETKITEPKENMAGKSKDQVRLVRRKLGKRKIQVKYLRNIEKHRRKTKIFLD